MIQRFYLRRRGGNQGYAPSSALFRTAIVPQTDSNQPMTGVLETGILGRDRAFGVDSAVSVSVICTQNTFTANFDSVKSLDDFSSRQSELATARAVVNVMSAAWCELFSKLNKVKVTTLSKDSPFYRLLAQNNLFLELGKLVLTLYGRVSLIASDFDGVVPREFRSSVSIAAETSSTAKTDGTPAFPTLGRSGSTRGWANRR